MKMLNTVLSINVSCALRRIQHCLFAFLWYRRFIYLFIWCVGGMFFVLLAHLRTNTITLRSVVAIVFFCQVFLDAFTSETNDKYVWLV